jgi:cellulose synthase/poly-beta-1,6-N-acetylglucosamine synthase-like glycosyltransferase
VRILGVSPPRELRQNRHENNPTYSVVCPLYAEAQNELGNTGSAINAINHVRNRVGAVPLQASMTQQQVRTHLRDYERLVELALEGIRWLDLLRWNDMTPGYISSTFVAHNRRAALILAARIPNINITLFHSRT